MRKLNLRYLKYIGLPVLVLAACAAGGYRPVIRTPAQQTLSYIKSESRLFSLSADELDRCIEAIDSTNPASVQKVIASLGNCRRRYKIISFFLDYFFPAQANLYNAPAKYEVEEPSLEFEEPHGLQQIESILFAPHPERQKGILHELARVIRESASDIPSLLCLFDGSDQQIMESIRIELIRIMTLYITGYDAPCLKSGIREAAESLISMQRVIRFYKGSAGKKNELVYCSIGKAITYLNAGIDFNRFNRLQFLTGYALPLEHSFSLYLRSNAMEICSIPHLNYRATNLFRNEVISGTTSDKDLIDLGKLLFFEKSLSGNSTRSCATCHQPGKYFTDLLQVNLNMDGRRKLRRNTPTLLYSAYQSAQFWDGRAASITEQIKDVLVNPDEMNSSVHEVVRFIRSDSFYYDALAKSFPDHEKNDSVIMQEVEIALAAYLNTLAPFNSAFDQFMAGNSGALSSGQKRGFNLFMGKALCATCHFAPVFNGATPPFFQRSEYEVLGVPQNDNFVNPSCDEDKGRYEIFRSCQYSGAFKTPSIRNAARTAPYMHNGKFKSLDKTLDFYNQGGGAGLGLKIQNQTLSAKHLHLTSKEKKEIIDFIYALTDRPVAVGLRHNYLINRRIKLD